MMGKRRRLLPARIGESQIQVSTGERQHVASWTDSVTTQRTDRLFQTHQAALDGKTLLGARGQKATAALWGHAVDVQAQVIEHGYQIVDAQPEGDQYDDVRDITTEALEEMNRDMVRLTREVTAGVRSIVQNYDLPRTDTRGEIVRYFKPFPDE